MAETLQRYKRLRGLHGLHPSGETVKLRYTCHLMVFTTQATPLSCTISLAGEAQAGSAGEQPAQE